MSEEEFYNELIEYSKNGRYPLHMPGHKRNERLFDGIDPYKVDITEIDGFDNLHNPKGIILDAMKMHPIFLRRTELGFGKWKFMWNFSFY